ncbi:MAG TPA: protein phosphatase 2C domain-containing protein [Rhizobacter sp.]|nr:protein phosphatase 2C domain-containing protein [Rhizobacter sp.]
MLQVEIASRCEVGGRSHNEDDLRHGQSGSFCYAVLSDGAGGHRGGAIASDIVVRMTTLGLQSATQATPDELTRIACEANDALLQKQDKSSRDRMHATLVALWIDAQAEEALWTHVGDSRLYMLRHGRVAHVTQDDSVVQRMVAAGYLTPEEALAHPQKNQLLSAMGTEDGIEPNTVPGLVPLQDGDAFLLCSDGWWDHFHNDDIETTFATSTSPEEWLALMADNIQHAAKTRQDNYSAIAVWVGNPAETTRFSTVWGETVPHPL